MTRLGATLFGAAVVGVVGAAVGWLLLHDVAAAPAPVNAESPDPAAVGPDARLSDRPTPADVDAVAPAALLARVEAGRAGPEAAPRLEALVRRAELPSPLRARALLALHRVEPPFAGERVARIANDDALPRDLRALARGLLPPA